MTAVWRAAGLVLSIFLARSFLSAEVHPETGPGLSLIKTADLTPLLAGTGSGNGRPDVVAIGGILYLAYGDLGKRNFQLLRLRAGLELILVDERPIELFSGKYDQSIDIRVSRSGDCFWYAFEDMEKKAGRKFTKHVLNAAWYGLNPFKPAASRTELALGVTSALPEAFSVAPSSVGKDPEAVDDPTPFWFNGKYFIFTRAWSGMIPQFTPNTVHHIRGFDKDFTQTDDFTLDLSSAMPGLTLSQNSLADIDGTPYLIGGFYRDRKDMRGGSRVYAIPLSKDLRAAAGDKTPLITGAHIWAFKTTSARYRPPYLFINYSKTSDGQAIQYIAAFDVKAGFKPAGEAELSRYANGDVGANHATFDVWGDKLYAFYPGKGKKIFAKIYQLRGLAP